MSTATNERIDMLSPEVKELIVRAASTAGMSVSAFLLGSAQEKAKQILAENETITLSARDWNAFAKALDNTEKPLTLSFRGRIEGLAPTHNRREFSCEVPALD